MNGGDGNPQTPFQEAISLITIVAILVGVGAYVAALKNVPLLSPALFWVAVQVYYLFPALMSLPGSQVPMLVAAGAVGTMFFIFTIPLAYWLAGVFSRAGIDSMERQTARLKRLRSDHKKRRRDNDKFSVEHYSAIARKSTSLILDLEVVMQTVAEHKVSNDFQSARELWN